MDIRKTPFILIGAALLILIGLAVFKADRAEAPSRGAPSTSTSVKPGSSAFAYDNASGDTIQVDLPIPGATVGKTFSVSGKARGPWYFEASFPVVLLDKNGNQLVAVPAQAEGEWMTNEFVPFTAELTVPASYAGPATLVLKKDNPSGLPEHEASVSFPIMIE